MTYPEAKYHGSQGERSARWRARTTGSPTSGTGTGAPRTTSRRLRPRVASSACTGGTSRTERAAPSPTSTGRSPSRSSSSTGPSGCYDGEGWTDAEAGDFLRVPPGGVHAFRNESGAAGLHAAAVHAGAPREEYFEWLDQMGRGLRTLTEQEREAFHAPARHLLGLIPGGPRAPARRGVRRAWGARGRRGRRARTGRWSARRRSARPGSCCSSSSSRGRCPSRKQESSTTTCAVSTGRSRGDRSWRAGRARRARAARPGCGRARAARSTPLGVDSISTSTVSRSSFQVRGQDQRADQQRGDRVRADPAGERDRPRPRPGRRPSRARR